MIVKLKLSCVVAFFLCVVLGCSDPKRKGADAGNGNVSDQELAEDAKDKQTHDRLVLKGASLLRAVESFESVYHSYPARYSVDSNGRPLLSWRVHVLPFMGYQELYDQFALDEPWDSEQNRKLIERIPAEFVHPELKLDAGKTNYLAVAGSDVAAAVPKSNRQGGRPPLGTRCKNILDGLSNTAYLVETLAEHAVEWTQPADFEYEEYDDPVSRLFQFQGCVMVGWMDTHTSYVQIESARKHFAILAMINDGEPVGVDEIKYPNERRPKSKD